MRTTKLLLAGVIATAVAFTAAGCAGTATASAPETNASGVTTLKVGASFPATDILNYVESSQAAAAGLDLQVSEFSEYITPDTSLEDGSLDANLYQHLPFLNQFNKDHGTHIVPVGKVYFPPLALYSKKITSLDAIASGDTISIPSDVTNERRALLLLEKAGLITLNPNAAGPADIATNPKNLQFQELDAATLPRALDDVKAGIVNLTYALPAGLTSEQQIYKEDVTGTPYTNLLAVKSGNENNAAIQKLYALLTSKQTQDWITAQYKGLVIPASGAAQ
ncbi:MetQ/NlpA family ABC transporter substrate-binding protein [Subtercola sp. RTI3]|nr:MetQ/NlpA family ABC transporter substrate-binding protein [Subtercola sp. RTI3]MEA9987187.1 MetQ/NlpA family ABC transporter substrate-binding protein [Subtercola sp. RTI3]